MPCSIFVYASLTFSKNKALMTDKRKNAHKSKLIKLISTWVGFVHVCAVRTAHFVCKCCIRTLSSLLRAIDQSAKQMEHKMRCNVYFIHSFKHNVHSIRSHIVIPCCNCHFWWNKSGLGVRIDGISRFQFC